MPAIETDVAIVGGGPVGLSLALDLAARGVEVAVLERRPAGERPSVKCNHVSSRSMEFFRRIGLAQDVRAAGLPDNYPNDVVFRTTLLGPEMGRIHIPSRKDRFSDTSGPDGWWPTPEPPHRINQIYLEPILFAQAAANTRIRLLTRHEAGAVTEDEEGVEIAFEDLAQGRSGTLRARWLVGCDGARSGVRRAMGGRFEGDAVIQRVVSSHIRAPDLLRRIAGRPGWLNYSYNLTRPGTVIAIDGVQDWLVHCYLLPSETRFEDVDRDAQLRAILGVDETFAYELIAKEDWIGRRLIADRFRSGRTFLCGDAAHIWVPYAGYGMNAGIADAMTLSWMLAAHLRGWAPAAILDAYAEERGPITSQVSHFAMDHAGKAIRERNTLPPCIEDDTQEGARAREEVGRRAVALNLAQFCCAGLNFGYYYDASSIIAHDAETAPAYAMGTYTPSTVPGCRAPHVWLEGGRSLYDEMGADYSLVRSDLNLDVAPLAAAAAVRGAPLAVVDLDPAAAAAYDHALVLVRPDRHVAWRGDRLPADPGALIDLVRGAQGGAGARSQREGAPAG